MKISKREGYVGSGGDTRLEYDEAPHAITGAEVRQYGPPEYSNLGGAVTAAINDISERQVGTSGITIICHVYIGGIASVLESLRQLSHDTIFYFTDGMASKLGVTNATETEMKMWLSGRRNTILVTEMYYCRGWEDNSVIALDHSGYGDNMSMRAVANLAIVKSRDIKSHKPWL